eukprot:PhF_6_TR7519/c0_g1_i1/m.11136
MISSTGNRYNHTLLALALESSIARVIHNHEDPTVIPDTLVDTLRAALTRAIDKAVCDVPSSSSHTLVLTPQTPFSPDANILYRVVDNEVTVVLKDCTMDILRDGIHLVGRYESDYVRIEVTQSTSSHNAKKRNRE